jgi:hypothetical protein
MSGDIQKLCNNIVGKTVVGCEVDFENQIINMEFDDGSLLEIAGDELDIYMDFLELDS